MDLLSLLVHIKIILLIVFAENLRGVFALQKLLTFSSAKNYCVFVCNMFESSACL